MTIRTRPPSRMRTLRLTVQYDGTAFAGWQVQKNVRTVQGEIARAARQIFGGPVKITGAGRTDTGVHATGQVAHIKTRSRLDTHPIRKAFITNLPEDIVVTAVEDAPPAFNAQFDAISRVYEYRLISGESVNPLVRHCIARTQFRLDLGAMRRAVKHLIGRHDFCAFQGSSTKPKSSVRTLMRLVISRKKNLITFEIEADGFLYTMVRSIVGTLIEVGRGRIAPGEMRSIISSKDRARSGPTAPAKGLCLTRVVYHRTR